MFHRALARRPRQVFGLVGIASFGSQPTECASRAENQLSAIVTVRSQLPLRGSSGMDARERVVTRFPISPPDRSEEHRVRAVRYEATVDASTGLAHRTPAQRVSRQGLKLGTGCRLP